MRSSDKFGAFGGVVFVLVLLGIFGVSCVGGCGQGYSEGDRAGVIVKLSRKGLIWKSWEGEMRLGGDQNVTSDAWVFSVRDESLVKPLQEHVKSGRRITVHYTEWVLPPIENHSRYEAQKVSGDNPLCLTYVPHLNPLLM